MRLEDQVLDAQAAAAAQPVRLREAAETDIGAITSIYNEAVSEGQSNYAATAEREDERRGWWLEQQRAGLPVLVAALGGAPDSVVGFGALTPFHRLEGYRFTVTGQLYVASRARQRGVGRRLAARLIEMARHKGLKTIIAGIHAHNRPCIDLHLSLGFKHVGYFEQIGFKNGRWHDDVCLQLIL